VRPARAGRRTPRRSAPARPAGRPSGATPASADRDGHPALFVLGGLLVLGLFAWQAWYFRGWTVDDAAISYRYARNLAHGLGLVFNPGFEGEPVEGFTNLLWVLWTAPCFWLRLDPVAWSKLWGLLSGCGVLLLLGAIGRRDRLWAPLVWVPALLTASHPAFAAWSVAGLEMSFFTFWLVAAFAALRFERRGLAALCGALALLTRPEAALFLALLAMVDVLDGTGPPRSRVLALRWMGPIVLVGLGLACFRAIYFHALVPNTYLVKGSITPESIRAGWVYVGGMLGVAHLGVVAAIVVTGAAILAPRWRNERSSSPRRTALLFGVSMTLACAAYLVAIGGDFMGLYRLFVPALPFLYLATAIVVEALPARGAARAARFLALALLIAVSGDAVRQRVRFADYTHVGEAIGRVQGDIATYLKGHARPGDEVIAQDMGFLPFLAGDLTFVDVIGLCNRRVAREVSAARHDYYAVVPPADVAATRRSETMDRHIRDYLFSRRARWILIPAALPRRVWSTEQAARSLESIDLGRYDGVLDPAFSHNHFFHGLYGDPRMKAAYAPVTAWVWSREYVYVLWERRGAGS